MGSERDESALALTLRVLERVGVLGILVVLWTVVACCALVASEHETVRYLWTYLFWTWIVLAVLGLISPVVLTIAGREAQRGASSVRILEPRAQGKQEGAEQVEKDTEPES